MRLYALLATMLAALLAALAPAAAQTPTAAHFGLAAGANPRTLFAYDTSGAQAPLFLVDAATHKATLVSSGGIFIDGSRAPVAGVLKQPLKIYGNYSGTPTTTFNFLHGLNADSYAVDDSIAGGGYNLFVGSRIDTGQRGHHAAIQGLVVLGTPSSNLPADNKFYVGSTGHFIGLVSDNGSSPSQDAGNGFGGNWIADLNGAARNFRSLIGGEIDMIARAGSSVNYKGGLQVVSDAGDAVQGTISDFGIGFAKHLGSVGFKKLITLSIATGDWPLSSGGTLIGTEPSALVGATPFTAGWGVDLRAVSFSNAAFASNNFQVAGSGTVSGFGYNFGTIDRNVSVTRTLNSNAYNDPLDNQRAKIIFKNVAGASSSDGSLEFWTSRYGISSGTRVTIDPDGILVAGLAIQLGASTVAGLGACGATQRGRMLHVTDGAAALAWGATVTGGGAAVYQVFCNGAAWTVAAK